MVIFPDSGGPPECLQGKMSALKYFQDLAVPPHFRKPEIEMVKCPDHAKRPMTPVMITSLREMYCRSAPHVFQLVHKPYWLYRYIMIYHDISTHFFGATGIAILRAPSCTPRQVWQFPTEHQHLCKLKSNYMGDVHPCCVATLKHQSGSSCCFYFSIMFKATMKTNGFSENMLLPKKMMVHHN